MADSSIGTRINAYRTRLEISLEDLSKRTGLDVDFLESLENNPGTPALGVLVKISRALGTRLGTFMDDELSADPLIVRLAERTAEETLSPSGENTTGMAYHPLGKGKADRHMEPFFIRLAPTEGDEPSLSSHEGEEFIVVHSGEVLLRYGNEEHILRTGDSMYYNSVVPHFVGCHGDSPAEIYAVVHIPF